MASFIVDITYRVRLESEHYKTVEELENIHEYSSRCFEDYMLQIADNIRAYKKENPDYCRCAHIINKEVVREATEDDMQRFMCIR